MNMIHFIWQNCFIMILHSNKERIHVYVLYYIIPHQIYYLAVGEELNWRAELNCQSWEGTSLFRCQDSAEDDGRGIKSRTSGESSVVCKISWLVCLCFILFCTLSENHKFRTCSSRSTERNAWPETTRFHFHCSFFPPDCVICCCKDASDILKFPFKMALLNKRYCPPTNTHNGRQTQKKEFSLSFLWIVNR